MLRCRTDSLLGGFTITELMATVSIIGVLAAIGAPSLKHGLDIYRVKQSSEALAQAYGAAKELARAENVDCMVELKNAPSGILTRACSQDGASLGGKYETISYGLDQSIGITASESRIEFSARGLNFTQAGQVLTLLVRDADAVSQSREGLIRCIEVGTPTGGVRTGIYRGTRPRGGVIKGGVTLDYTIQRNACS